MSAVYVALSTTPLHARDELSSRPRTRPRRRRRAPSSLTEADRPRSPRRGGERGDGESPTANPRTDARGLGFGLDAVSSWTRPGRARAWTRSSWTPGRARAWTRPPSRQPSRRGPPRRRRLASNQPSDQSAAASSAAFFAAAALAAFSACASLGGGGGGRTFGEARLAPPWRRRGHLRLGTGGPVAATAAGADPAGPGPPWARRRLRAWARALRDGDAVLLLDLVHRGVPPGLGLSAAARWLLHATGCASSGGASRDLPSAVSAISATGAAVSGAPSAERGGLGTVTRDGSSVRGETESARGEGARDGEPASAPRPGCAARRARGGARAFGSQIARGRDAGGRRGRTGCTAGRADDGGERGDGDARRPRRARSLACCAAVAAT